MLISAAILNDGLHYFISNKDLKRFTSFTVKTLHYQILAQRFANYPRWRVHSWKLPKSLKSGKVNHMLMKHLKKSSNKNTSPEFVDERENEQVPMQSEEYSAL